MPLIIQIPEADRIRRLAASLTTSKLNRRVTEAGELDFGQTVRFYFRRIPWSGRRSVTVDALLDMSLVTVGQYFLSMDWDGTGIALSAPVETAELAEGLDAGFASADSLTTPVENVSLDGFFNDFFGN